MEGKARFVGFTAIPSTRDRTLSSMRRTWKTRCGSWGVVRIGQRSKSVPQQNTNLISYHTGLRSSGDTSPCAKPLRSSYTGLCAVLGVWMSSFAPAANDSTSPAGGPASATGRSRWGGACRGASSVVQIYPLTGANPQVIHGG